MPQRNVASNFTFEQQRVEINNLAQDFWSQKGTVDTALPTFLKHDGSNAFTGQTLSVPNAFTINSNSGNGTVTISGNLQVDGTTTTVNTATMDVVDKNITIAKGSANDAAADGAGITIDSATDITFNFVDAKDALVSSIGLEATTFIKSTRAQFTGAGNPTTGQGLELTAPDQNTGQIASYDRDTPAYKELRLKGSSVSLYTGTTNALVGTFNSTGLTLDSGDLTIPNDIIHTGDTDTKIAFTDNAIGITTGASERLQISNFGLFVQAGLQLGFLATSGPSPSIKSGGTDNQDLLLTTGASNPTRLTIESGGDYLFLGGTLRIKNSANNAQHGAIYGDSTSFYVNAAGNLRLYSGGGERVVLSDNGQISIRGTTTAFDTTGDLDSLQMYYETDSGQASIGPYSSGGSTHLSFYTNSGGAAATEKVQIDTNGNLLPKQTSGTQNLGSGSNRWLDVYTENLNVTKASGNLSTYITATNGLGTIEIAGSTGAFIDLKSPTSDDYDMRVGTSGTGGYINTDSNSNLSVNCPIIPDANGQYDLGGPSNRWSNIYSADLQLSNKGSTNEVDGTWGDFTIQEGESDLFLINRRNGKKYKFNLTEVS